MEDTHKNLVVGLFVIAGLIALGTMILLFGEAPQAFTRSYLIKISFPSAGPVKESDPILLNGLQVGNIESIKPMSDIRKGVEMVCRINAKYRIPIDAQPLIKEQTMALGKPAIRIDVGPQNSDKMLPTDGTGELVGYVAGGLEELIPRETMKELEEAGLALTNLAKALEPVAKDLHELFKPVSVEKLDQATGPSRPLANISTVVQRFDRSLKSINKIMADPNNQKNLSMIIKNFRTISEQGLVLSAKLNSLTDRLQKLTGSADKKLTTISSALMDNSSKLSTLLDRLNNIAYKADEGKGAIAKWLNDPELYDALVLTTKRLSLALDDLHQLLQQWRVKGLKLQGGLIGK